MVEKKHLPALLILTIAVPAAGILFLLKYLLEVRPPKLRVYDIEHRPPRRPVPLDDLLKREPLWIG